MKCQWLLLFFFPILAIQNCFAEPEEASGPVGIVHKLYRDFAWEAVISNPEDKGLSEQPKTMLERYFTSRLTDLILEDRACMARTKGICNLDFLPLWDSQDPAGASDMEITSGRGNTVNVEFKYQSDGSKIKIVYQTTKVSGAWRISDIRYKNGRSLISILKSKE
jgi:hypothetical protein